MRLFARNTDVPEHEIDRNAPPKRGAARFGAIVGREWWELVKLNALLIVFCLPVVTIPAALAGGTRITAAMVADQNHYLFDDFWETFRARFVAASAIGWLVLAALGIGIFAIVAYAHAIADTALFLIPVLVSALGAILIALAGSHLLTQAVLTDLPLGRMLRNAGLLALAWFFPGLGALGLVALIWILHIVAYPVSIFIPATLGFSLSLLIMTFQSQTALERYVFRARSDVPETLDYPSQEAAQGRPTLGRET